MNSTRPTQSGNGRTVGQAVLPGNGEIPRGERGPENAAAVPQLSPKRLGYGLPCATCRTYYAADQTVCPVCKATERVSPNAVSPVTAVNEPAPEDCGDDAVLEVERERFLREFKSQVYAAHMQINAATSICCSKEENHQGSFAPAAVCQGCYDHLQERMDLMEAARSVPTVPAITVARYRGSIVMGR